jgi:hypothetical protein
MKYDIKKTYLTILNDWLNGGGINLQQHNLSKHDAFIMVAWYQNYLSQQTLNAITLAIINELIDEP